MLIDINSFFLLFLYKMTIRHSYSFSSVRFFSDLHHEVTSHSYKNETHFLSVFTKANRTVSLDKKDNTKISIKVLIEKGRNEKRGKRGRKGVREERWRKEERKEWRKEEKGGRDERRKRERKELKSRRHLNYVIGTSKYTRCESISFVLSERKEGLSYTL